MWFGIKSHEKIKENDRISGQGCCKFKIGVWHVWLACPHACQVPCVRAAWACTARPCTRQFLRMLHVLLPPALAWSVSAYAWGPSYVCALFGRMVCSCMHLMGCPRAQASCMCNWAPTHMRDLTCRERAFRTSCLLLARVQKPLRHRFFLKSRGCK